MLCRSLAHGRDIVDSKMKWAVVGLALVMVFVLGALMVHRAAFSKELNSDFVTYRAVGWAVLNGSDIYEVRNSRGWPYVYPPPFAILMTPFAEMSAFAGSIVWYVLSVILVVSSVQMGVTMVGALGRFGRNPFWLYTLSFVMVLPWVGQAAVEGQTTILTLWLLMVALYRSQRGRDISAGTALACAGLIKVFPLALLAYFAWKRRWRLLVATMTALIVGGIALPGLVYGWQRNLTYWHEWVAAVAQPSLGVEVLRLQSKVNDRVLSPQNAQNQALRAVLWRLGAEKQARFLTVVVGSVMALAMLVFVRPTRSQQDLLIAAAWLAWIVVIAPVSHFHYHMLVLLPMTVLAFLALVKTDSLLTTLARVTLIFYLLASVCALALPSLQYVGLLCWTTLGLWVVLLFVAARYDTRPETCDYKISRPGIREGTGYKRDPANLENLKLS
jgi:alpha-1,2-mannosyltransferase